MLALNIVKLDRGYPARRPAWFFASTTPAGWRRIRGATIVAGDWIKMRVLLKRDPKVTGIADFLAHDAEFVSWLTDPVRRHCDDAYEHVTRDVVASLAVTALLQVWGIVRDRAFSDGLDAVLASCSITAIDAMADIPAFGHAMADVGWITEEDHCVRFHNYLRDNELAKPTTAMTGAERQRKHRARARSDAESGHGMRDENVTLPCVTGVTDSNDRQDKTREEKKEQQQQGPHDPSSDSVVVVSMLRGVGIAEGTADDLAGEFGLDRVREVIALAENTQATNPSGYVIHALRQGWTAPKARESVPVVRTPQQGGPAPSEIAHHQDVLARAAQLTDEQIASRCAALGGSYPDAWASGDMRRDSFGDMEDVVKEI